MTPTDPDRIGLCLACRHARRVPTPRATYWLCTLSATDPNAGAATLTRVVAADSNIDVRLAAARHPNAASTLLSDIAESSSDQRIWRAVLSHPNLDAETSRQEEERQHRQQIPDAVVLPVVEREHVEQQQRRQDEPEIGAHTPAELVGLGRTAGYDLSGVLGG